MTTEIDTLAQIGKTLIIEFVPKSDAMAQRLLASRRDVFDDYSIDGFRAAMNECFSTVSETPIEGTARTLFHFARRT